MAGAAAWRAAAAVARSGGPGARRPVEKFASFKPARRSRCHGVGTTKDPAGRYGLRWDHAGRNHARELQSVDDKRSSIYPIGRAPRPASRRLVSLAVVVNNASEGSISAASRAPR